MSYLLTEPLKAKGFVQAPVTGYPDHYISSNPLFSAGGENVSSPILNQFSFCNYLHCDFFKNYYSLKLMTIVCTTGVTLTN